MSEFFYAWQSASWWCQLKSSERESIMNCIHLEKTLLMNCFFENLEVLIFLTSEAVQHPLHIKVTPEEKENKCNIYPWLTLTHSLLWYQIIILKWAEGRLPTSDFFLHQLILTHFQLDRCRKVEQTVPPNQPVETIKFQGLAWRNWIKLSTLAPPSLPSKASK